jgi:hypothetical protein
MLNRRPGGADTNSLAVLAVHALSSTRWKVCVAVGAPLPRRIRDEEFLTTVSDAASLLRVIGELHADSARLLSKGGPIDWQTRRVLPFELDPDDLSDRPAFSLVFAMAHLREHVGQMLLTRQLFDGTNEGPR